MKKYLIILSVIIFLSLIIITTHKPKTDLKSTMQITEVETVQSYTLRDYKGYIALFVGNSQNPERVYEVFTSSLPPSDVTALKQGITVYSASELEKILCDYLS